MARRKVKMSYDSKSYRIIFIFDLSDENTIY